MMTVSYFSGGVSSAVATMLAIADIDRIMYTHIDDQHPDTMRFVRDCEAWFGKPVEIMQSPLKCVDHACRMASFIRSRNGGAACTKRLKREVRKQFERENERQMTIVWGLDLAEADRAMRVCTTMPNHEHRFPLIDARMSKEHAHEVLRASGIKRPAMYDLGYHNNNCIGCVKGGMGYWNKIRVDFPEVFAARSAMERLIGFPIIGKGIWLDELDPERGRHAGPICDDCGIMCELMSISNGKDDTPK
jgi:3'-phosphoadenosine 5'-phosphosulfate sulfotransferase (PAPS reductase)/FAD synthetase